MVRLAGRGYSECNSNSPLPSLPPPKPCLVLGGTLCSCEACGMIPMYKKRIGQTGGRDWEWLADGRRDRGRKECACMRAYLKELGHGGTEGDHEGVHPLRPLLSASCVKVTQQRKLQVTNKTTTCIVFCKQSLTQHAIPAHRYECPKPATRGEGRAERADTHGTP
jgi:hypothetical protein